MKKFIFSLQKVLEIKQQFLENLKAELGNLNNELNIREENIKMLKNKFEEANAGLVKKSSASVTAGEMIYYKMYMDCILKQVEKKEEEKAVILRKIDAKRHEIINMNMEISGLEKLRDKEYEEYTKDAMKKEEIFIEEFVSNKKMAEKYAV